MLFTFLHIPLLQLTGTHVYQFQLPSKTYTRSLCSPFAPSHPSALFSSVFPPSKDKRTRLVWHTRRLTFRPLASDSAVVLQKNNFKIYISDACRVPVSDLSETLAPFTKKRFVILTFGQFFFLFWILSGTEEPKYGRYMNENCGYEKKILEEKNVMPEI